MLMLIENRTTWKADHIRAIVEAAVKATGYDTPIERIVIRRSGYTRMHLHCGCLVLRMAPADATPLETLAIGRQVSGKRYRHILAQLVGLFVPYNFNNGALSYDDRERTRNNIIRRTLGLGDAAVDATCFTVFSEGEEETFEIPAWADLPLAAGEKGKARTGERVETLRAQLLARENARTRLIEDQARLVREADMEIESARQRLAVAEAKLNAPKKQRRKKSDVALALTG